MLRLADALEEAAKDSAQPSSALICLAISHAENMGSKSALLFAPAVELARRAWVYLIDGESERARELLEDLMEALGVNDRSRGWKGSAAIDAAKEKP